MTEKRYDMIRKIGGRKVVYEMMTMREIKAEIPVSRDPRFQIQVRVGTIFKTGEKYAYYVVPMWDGREKIPKTLAEAIELSESQPWIEEKYGKKEAV
jgi:hypothetical protein